MSTKFQAKSGRVRTQFTRPEQWIVDAFTGVPTSIISDCLDRFNVIDPAIAPLLPGANFAGTAFTVEEIEGGNLMSHLALKHVQPGDVLVINGKGITTRACWGGLQTLSAKLKGVAAIIVDGAIRDADDVVQLQMPLYCRAVSPAGPHKGWGGRVNEAISCGGQPIEPGDVIVGDRDGVVVIPHAEAEETCQRAKEKIETENAWFEQVKAGADTADFLGFMEVAQRLGVQFD